MAGKTPSEVAAAKIEKLMAKQKRLVEELIEKAETTGKLTIEEMRELAGRNIEDTEENTKLIRRLRICRNVLRIYDEHQATRDFYWREKTPAAARKFLRKRDNGRI